MFHLRERFDHRDLELIQYYELQYLNFSYEAVTKTHKDTDNFLVTAM
jgi:hypothetical protein